MKMSYVGVLTVLYYIVLSIELYGEIVQNFSIIWAVKPLLMPLLLILFLLNSQKNLLIERICLIVSLALSCIGDILFIKDRKDLFLYGISVYLIVHICYILSFIVLIKQEGKLLQQRLTFSSMIIPLVPFFIYLIYFLSILYPKLNNNSEETKDLLFPILIYGFIIVGMGYISYLRGRKIPGFWSVFLGALFFILSDSILAFNKFVSHIPVPSLSIMFTYGIGQYLITIGTLQVTQKYSKNI
ncbi:unnamed protein product [Didymodactylos carnosus]|uniref:lysoplasmalogenase n=1 Tax=Didymodactylos carnosus TaxID=1234261 RepID=A0A814ZGI0_9BILA|nr:unnamed protein product [Didymodactylos carnosus]CAF1368331.1 unnamed protein product [Didymodactylos carnosus]CAF4007676.1 unnamed protein product [Didymodactylos carnosus]CAF4177615.1 unnamed protein product [Didymodactylos carnosus]